MSGFVYEKQKTADQKILEIYGKGEAVGDAEKYIESQCPIRLMNMINNKRYQQNRKPPPA